MSRRFDLKGSTANRITPKSEFDEGATGKDLNFLQGEVKLNKMYIGPALKRKFVAQIDYDRHFLTVNNIMDYSLLLGIFRRSSSSEHVARSNSLIVAATAGQ